MTGGQTKFEAALGRRLPGDSCQCWDHLRAAGLTPPRDDARRFRRYPKGEIMRTDNGARDTDDAKREREEKSTARAKREVGL